MVIIEAVAGRCADINESVSFLGRVIGKVNVTANSIFKIVKATVPKQFSAPATGGLGK